MQAHRAALADAVCVVPPSHHNFDAPAVLRKWPSLNNQRRTEGTGGPYLLLDGTLDECIRESMAQPAPVRHLYSIRMLISPSATRVIWVMASKGVLPTAR